MCVMKCIYITEKGGNGGKRIYIYIYMNESPPRVHIPV